MLDLRRLRLLRELHARGTIAAVADALQFTPSAVSQQLAALEREAGVPLLVRAGRGVRLTDPALVLVDHAGALLDRAELAEAELAASAAASSGAAASPPSSPRRCASPCRPWRRWRATRRGLRCELVEAEPEQALPELTLGGVDLVLADEWQQQPHPRLARVDRHELHRDTVRSSSRRPIRSRAGTPTGSRSPRSRDAAWTVGHAGTPWGDMVEAPAASTAASTPTSATAPTTPSSASPSSPRAKRSRCCPTWSRPRPARASSMRASPAASVHRTIVAATRARGSQSGRPCRRCLPPCAPRRSASLQAIAQPLELVGDVAPDAGAHERVQEAWGAELEVVGLGEARAVGS